jgi:hypothetical protein
MPSSRVKDLTLSYSKNPCGKGLTEKKMKLLSRFVGTGEGEVTTYLGCELIRNHAAQTTKLVQKGYVERALRTFGMKKEENTLRVHKSEVGYHSGTLSGRPWSPSTR